MSWQDILNELKLKKENPSAIKQRLFSDPELLKILVEETTENAEDISDLLWKLDVSRAELKRFIDMLSPDQFVSFFKHAPDYLDTILPPSTLDLIREFGLSKVISTINEDLDDNPTIDEVLPLVLGTGNANDIKMLPEYNYPGKEEMSFSLALSDLIRNDRKLVQTRLAESKELQNLIRQEIFPEVEFVPARLNWDYDPLSLDVIQARIQYNKSNPRSFLRRFRSRPWSSREAKQESARRGSSREAKQESAAARTARISRAKRAALIKRKKQEALTKTNLATQAKRRKEIKTLMPDVCFDFNELDDVAITDYLRTPGNVIIVTLEEKTKNAVCSSYSQLTNAMRDATNIYYKCVGPTGGFPVNKKRSIVKISMPHQIFVLRKQLKQALSEQPDVLVIGEATDTWTTTASKNAIETEDYVSSDHCQAGTKKAISPIVGLKL